MPLPIRSSPTIVELDIVVSIVAMTIGSLILAAPDRAAGIWASQRYAKATPEKRAVLVGWYRILGIFVFFAGVLLAVHSFGYG